MITPEAVTPLSAEALFDSIGPAYESAFAGLHGQTDSINWLKDMIDPKKPAKFLDIGCGTGYPVCYELGTAGHDVLGIDISSTMIKDARQKVPLPNVRFEKANILEHNISPASFDAISVYFSMLASFTQDQIRETISRIYEWLKPGGIFVFATVPLSEDNVEIKWMGRRVIVSSLGGNEIIQYLEKVGFEIIKHHTSTFLPKAVQAGLCKEEDVWEEPHLFVYAKRS